MIRVKLTAAQFSALECSGISECPDNATDIALLCAWSGQNFLYLDPSQLDAVLTGVNDASNSEDDFANETTNDAAMRKHARGAALALSNLGSKLITAAR